MSFYILFGRYEYKEEIMKTNTDKNGNKFHNFGSGKDRVVVYEPKDSKKPAVFDNNKKLNKK